MIKRMVATLALATLLMGQAFAGNGLLFNVSASGTPANVNITLCLNGKGPLTCQNYTVSALNLKVITTVPNHVYPTAGIKINTPGYTIGNLGLTCVPSGNGYCLFSASNNSSATILIQSIAAAAVPGAPNIGTATPGNAQATINWIAPVNNGGSSITGYTVTSTPAVTTPSACKNTTNTSCIFTGLTNGISYTFTVVAINAIGASASSAPSNAVTPVFPRIYTGTENGNVPISTNGGVSWVPTVQQPDGSPVLSVFVSGTTLYAGTNNGNVEVSTDGGMSWTSTTQPDGSSVLSVFVSGTTLYAGTASGNVEVSTDGGASWTPTAQPDGSAVLSVFVNGATLYVGTDNGNVEVSTDGGASWALTVSPDGSRVYSVFVSGGTWYAGTENGNVEVSTNGGASWVPTMQPASGSIVFSVFVSGATLYTGTADGNVEVSKDHGTSWIPTAQPDGSAVRSVFVGG
ncbi:MAG: fibronectin type III domain-containing protein [Gammaproteobacteria bacterium]|nr:fibronectin type III domain-containing protein [Gammaproteobacteria bacterium]